MCRGMPLVRHCATQSRPAAQCSNYCSCVVAEARRDTRAAMRHVMRGLGLGRWLAARTTMRPAQRSVASLALARGHRPSLARLVSSPRINPHPTLVTPDAFASSRTVSANAVTPRLTRTFASTSGSSLHRRLTKFYDNISVVRCCASRTAKVTF